MTEIKRSPHARSPNEKDRTQRRQQGNLDVAPRALTLGPGSGQKRAGGTFGASSLKRPRLDAPQRGFSAFPRTSSVDIDAKPIMAGFRTPSVKPKQSGPFMVDSSDEDDEEPTTPISRPQMPAPQTDSNAGQKSAEKLAGEKEEQRLKSKALYAFAQEVKRHKRLGKPPPQLPRPRIQQPVAPIDLTGDDPSPPPAPIPRSLLAAGNQSRPTQTPTQNGSQNQLTPKDSVTGEKAQTNGMRPRRDSMEAARNRLQLQSAQYKQPRPEIEVDPMGTAQKHLAEVRRYNRAQHRRSKSGEESDDDEDLLQLDIHIEQMPSASAENPLGSTGNEANTNSFDSAIQIPQTPPAPPLPDALATKLEETKRLAQEESQRQAQADKKRAEEMRLKQAQEAVERQKFMDEKKRRQEEQRREQARLQAEAADRRRQEALLAEKLKEAQKIEAEEAAKRKAALAAAPKPPPVVDEKAAEAERKRQERQRILNERNARRKKEEEEAENEEEEEEVVVTPPSPPKPSLRQSLAQLRAAQTASASAHAQQDGPKSLLSLGGRAEIGAAPLKKSTKQSPAVQTSSSPANNKNSAQHEGPKSLASFGAQAEIPVRPLNNKSAHQNLDTTATTSKKAGRDQLPSSKEITQEDGCLLYWRDHEDCKWPWQDIVDFNTKPGEPRSDDGESHSKEVKDKWKALQNKYQRRYRRVSNAVKDAGISQELLDKLREGDVVAKYQINVRVHGRPMGPEPPMPKIKLASRLPETPTVEDAPVPVAAHASTTSPSTTEPHPTTGGKTINLEMMHHLIAQINKAASDDDPISNADSDDEPEQEYFSYQVFRRLLTPEQWADYNDDPESIAHIGGEQIGEVYDTPVEANHIASQEGFGNRGSEDPRWVQGEWKFHKETLGHGLNLYTRESDYHTLQVWVERQLVCAEKWFQPEVELIPKTVYVIKQSETALPIPNSEDLFEEEPTPTPTPTTIDNIFHTSIDSANLRAIHHFVDRTYQPKTSNLQQHDVDKLEAVEELTNVWFGEEMFHGEGEVAGKVLKVWVEVGVVEGPRNV